MPTLEDLQNMIADTSKLVKSKSVKSLKQRYQGLRTHSRQRSQLEVGGLPLTDLSTLRPLLYSKQSHFKQKSVDLKPVTDAILTRNLSAANPFQWPLQPISLQSKERVRQNKY